MSKKSRQVRRSLIRRWKRDTHRFTTKQYVACQYCGSRDFICDFDDHPNETRTAKRVDKTVHPVMSFKKWLKHIYGSRSKKLIYKSESQWL